MRRSLEVAGYVAAAFAGGCLGCYLATRGLMLSLFWILLGGDAG